jgi:hypothetical protein
VKADCIILDPPYSPEADQRVLRRCGLKAAMGHPERRAIRQRP